MAIQRRLEALENCLKNQLGVYEPGECPGEIQQIEIVHWLAGEPEPPLPPIPLCSRCGKRHRADAQNIFQIVTVLNAPTGAAVEAGA